MIPDPIPKDPVAALVGFLRGKGPRVAELLEERRRERERDEAQERGHGFLGLPLDVAIRQRA